MDEFREYLKELLKKKGYSIRQLALKSDVDHSFLVRVLNGERNPSPKIIEKIAHHLPTTYEDLMYRAGYLKEEPPKMSLEEILKDYTLTWGDEELTEEEKEKAIKLLKIILEDKEKERD